jgi:beta-lactamase class A
MSKSALSRRGLVLSGVAGLVPAIARAAPGLDPWGARLAGIERRLGGRLGVLALDTASGARIGHRTGEHFRMCSSFKLLLAADVLARIDAGAEQAGRLIAYGPADVLEYAPVAKAHLAKGGLSVLELCAAAVEVSDNTAANLLLASIGGPAGLTRWLRSVGDPKTRLDRTETALNTGPAADHRDTTTPDAMVATMRKVLLGTVLSPTSRQELVQWMKNCKTGEKRLRAGLPKSWRVGDKTGTWTGAWASAVDVAIAWPPTGAPVLIAAFSNGGPAKPEARDAALAEVGQIVGEWAKR